MAELELWTRALTFVGLGYRMFVIKSLRKNLGMSILQICYGIVWRGTDDVTAQRMPWLR